MSCIITLYLFCNVRPSLLLKHATTLHPYLSATCAVSSMHRIRTEIISYINDSILCAFMCLPFTIPTQYPGSLCLPFTRHCCISVSTLYQALLYFCVYPLPGIVVFLCLPFTRHCCISVYTLYQAFCVHPLPGICVFVPPFYQANVCLPLPDVYTIIMSCTKFIDQNL